MNPHGCVCPTKELIRHEFARKILVKQLLCTGPQRYSLAQEVVALHFVHLEWSGRDIKFFKLLAKHRASVNLILMASSSTTRHGQNPQPGGTREISTLPVLATSALLPSALTCDLLPVSSPSLGPASSENLDRQQSVGPAPAHERGPEKSLVQVLRKGYVLETD